MASVVLYPTLSEGPWGRTGIPHAQKEGAEPFLTSVKLRLRKRCRHELERPASKPGRDGYWPGRRYFTGKGDDAFTFTKTIFFYMLFIPCLN